MNAMLRDVIRIAPLFAALLMLAGSAPSQERQYVGSETCLGCHDDYTGWIKGSVHENVTLKEKNGEQATGCEACHGPGSAHVNDYSAKGAILAFTTDEPSDQRVNACLNCHNQLYPELNHRRADHIRRGLGCEECHASTGAEAFHKMREVKDVMGGQQPKLCYRCHIDQRAGFALPYHHPVEEKFMECTTCHTPHGSYRMAKLKTRYTDRICAKCHEDVAGPFIFEHPPGRSAGCVACHQPHGSTNPRMLVRAQTQFLCLECHANTPSFHDLSQPEFRECTTCHSKVHGSNLDRHLFE